MKVLKEDKKLCFRRKRYICIYIFLLKKIQDISLVFRNFVFTASFVQSKRVVVDFYLPNSRFQWLLLLLFQEPAQDLTLFSFLEENCSICLRTYKSAVNAERRHSFFNFQAKFCLFFLILYSKIKVINILIEQIFYNYVRKPF